MSSINPASMGPPQTIALYGAGEYKKFTPQAAVFGVARVVDPAQDPNSAQNVQHAQAKKEQAQAAAIVAASRNKSKSPPADKNLLGRLSSQRARLASELTHVDTELSTRKAGQDPTPRVEAPPALTAAPRVTASALSPPPTPDGPVDAPPRMANLTDGMQPLPPAQPPEPSPKRASRDARPPRANTVGSAAAAGSPEVVLARRAAAQQAVQASARTRPAPPDDSRMKDLVQRRLEIELRLAHVDGSLQKVSQDLGERLSGLMQGIVQQVEEQAGAVAQTALGIQPDMGVVVELAAAHNGGGTLQIDVPETAPPLPTPAYNAARRAAGAASDTGFLINTSA